MFLGIQPAVTVEPHYASGSFDVNLLPLVVQVRLTGRSDLRFVSITNYHFGDDRGVSHVGGEIAFPLFIGSSEDRSLRSEGAFVAPVAGLTRNVREKGMEYTFAVEPGYFFAPGEHWGISVGVQVGATYFTRDSGARSHFGVKASFGRWAG